MYIYYFGSNKGRSNDIFVYEPDKKEWEKYKRFFEMKRDPKKEPFQKSKSTFWFKVEPKPDIPGTDHIRVRFTEGVVYKRAFWLKDLDLDKAESIVNNYLKEKSENLQKQLNSLKGELK